VKKFIFTLLTLCVAAHANAGDYNSTLDNLFQEIRSHLDYKDKSILGTIPEFEAKLLEQTNGMEKNLSNPSPKVRHDAALNLVYVAMYLKNNIIGAEKGDISYSELIKSKRFSKANSLAEELIARQQFVIELFKKVSAVLANDKRVPSWDVGSRLGLEKLQGKVTQQTVDGFIQTAIDYPNFNLFSVFLGTRDLPLTAKQSDEILKLAKEMAGPNNPCRPKNGVSDRNCGNTNKAPFNLQAALAELGDVLLHRAEVYLLANPPNLKDGMPLAYTAIGVYSSAFDEKNKGATAEWQHKASLTDRIEKANQLIKNRVSLSDYWKTDSAKNPYMCASCHSGTNSFVNKSFSFEKEFHPMFATNPN
jgi:hypothetical protein